MPKRSDFREGVWGTMKWSPTAPLEGGERGVTKGQYDKKPLALAAIPWNQMVLPDVYP